MVPKVGIEPTWGNPQRCLRPSRLPFRHFGVGKSRVYSKIGRPSSLEGSAAARGRMYV
jgi:hypothetical protein